MREREDSLAATAFNLRPAMSTTKENLFAWLKLILVKDERKILVER